MDAFRSMFAARRNGEGGQLVGEAPTPSGEGAEPEHGSMASQARALVSRATSDYLLTSDWGLNLDVVDFVERNGRGAAKHVVADLMRAIANARQTSLALTLALALIDACAKNCGTEFHEQMALAGMPHQVAILACAKGKQDAEVREAAKRLIEEWKAGIDLPVFREAHAYLEQRGETFEGGHVACAPIHTPPVRKGTKRSEEIAADKAAIASALAELEVASEAGHAAPADTLPESYGARAGPDTSRAFPGPARPTLRAAAVEESASRSVNASPLDPDDLGAFSNSCSLLREILESVDNADPDAMRSTLQDELVSFLIGQCKKAKEMVGGAIETTHDEARLVQMLTLHDSLEYCFVLYESLEKALAVLDHSTGEGGPAAAESVSDVVDTGVMLLPAPVSDVHTGGVETGGALEPVEASEALELEDIMLRGCTPLKALAKPDAQAEPPPADPFADLISFDSLPSGQGLAAEEKGDNSKVESEQELEASVPLDQKKKAAAPVLPMQPASSMLGSLLGGSSSDTPASSGQAARSDDLLNL